MDQSMTREEKVAVIMIAAIFVAMAVFAALR
jgi:cell division protein FtsL